MLRNFCAGSILARPVQVSAEAVTVLRAAPIFVLVTILAQGSAANAAEVKIFTSRAIATVLGKIGPEFERTTGHKLNVVSGFSPLFVKQINAGEPFDVVVSPTSTIDGLIKDGKVIAGTRTDLVRSGVGVGVRAGAPADFEHVGLDIRWGVHRGNFTLGERKPSYSTSVPAKRVPLAPHGRKGRASFSPVPFLAI